MVIFHSYVSLPEGNLWDKKTCYKWGAEIGAELFRFFIIKSLGSPKIFRMSRAGKVTCRFAIENGDFEIVDLAIENGDLPYSCLMCFLYV